MIKVPDPKNYLKRCEAREIYFDRLAKKEIKVSEKV
jgi:hypothetical protein